jgi:hypothetical protein
MRGFRLLLGAAVVIVAGSLNASALPTDGGRLAGIEADQSSMVTLARSSRRCFNSCIRGHRYRSCQVQDDKSGCCSQRCHRRRY